MKIVILASRSAIDGAGIGLKRLGFVAPILLAFISIFISACVSSTINVSDSTTPTDETALSYSLVAPEAVDADTGLTATDEGGHAVRAAIPVQANRTAGNAEEPTGADTQIASLSDPAETTTATIISGAVLVEQTNHAENSSDESGSVDQNSPDLQAEESDAQPESTDSVIDQSRFAAAPQVVDSGNFFERLLKKRQQTPGNSANRNRMRNDRRDDGSIVVATAYTSTASATTTRISARAPAVETGNQPEAILQKRSGSGDALPGVKSSKILFGIEDESVEEADGNLEVASLGSFGRLSPNGLRLQHDKVNVQCLKPGIMQLIRKVGAHYGKQPTITSGYRDPKRNRRAGGARNSTHIFCIAVDMQVEGVSKWDLAKYLRTLPGRGGVGTYCRTRSVHLDIGTKRDWHHPCRRSSVKKA